MKYKDDGSNTININETKKNISLRLYCEDTQYSWSLYEIDNNNNQKSLEFVVFSELFTKVFESTSIIAFYANYVLLLSTIIRTVFMSTYEDILFKEMPYPDMLITVIDGIKMARYKNQLDKEEELYYLLMELLRSSEILKIITKSSVKELDDRKQNL